MGRAWFDNEAPDIPLRGRQEVMEDWLTKKVPGHKLVVHSRSTGNWSDAIQPRSLLRALSNGHLDVECWVYVNKVKQFSTSRIGRDGRPQWDRFVAAYDTPTNWVMDMDDVPGVIGATSEERIASLFRRITGFGAFPPRTIVESSPGSFHLFYFGSKPGREWTWERRLATAMRAAGIARKVRTEKELETALKAGGVDLGYLKQPMELAKFRLPGSVNVKKSMGSVDTSKVVGNVVAVGWNNPDYRLPGVTELNDMDLLVPAKLSKKIEKRPLPDSAWKRFMPELRAGLTGFVKPEILDLLAEFLARNFNFLQKKKCRILQTFMAERLGVAQYTVSRLISEMKDQGWLIEEKMYQRGKYAKTYSSGPLLKICFEKALFAGHQYDLTEPYTDGESNKHFLRDVRVAVRLGIDVEDLIQIVQEKQSMRLAHKQRSAKTIARTYHLWLNRDRIPEVSQISA